MVGPWVGSLRTTSKAQCREHHLTILAWSVYRREECEPCIRDTEKWSPRQMQANHRGLGTETPGDGKSLEGCGTCAQVLTLRKGRRAKNLQSVINTRLGETGGGHQTEEHWPKRKQTRWGWHWCLGITVLESSLSKLGWCLLLGLGHILLLVGVMRWTYRAESSLKDFSVLLVLIQGKTK